MVVEVVAAAVVGSGSTKTERDRNDEAHGCKRRKKGGEGEN
jgi:hypothetical protein